MGGGRRGDHRGRGHGRGIIWGVVMRHGFRLRYPTGVFAWSSFGDRNHIKRSLFEERGVVTYLQVSGHKHTAQFLHAVVHIHIRFTVAASVYDPIPSPPGEDQHLMFLCGGGREGGDERGRRKWGGKREGREGVGGGLSLLTTSIWPIS